ncbi:expressed unknown protein [Seminavis robusta]|uniref:Uncharacterized protein n=1 Tax=Seminavis robusta TaxID=568900 RepID=A0A9N8DBW9_9STRA|nr:expressed unknown protein [Seminavis robusta]|eukprot:Sro49_g028790.1 n/a (628) ;mRNA; f:120364-122247
MSQEERRCLSDHSLEELEECERDLKRRRLAENSNAEASSASDHQSALSINTARKRLSEYFLVPKDKLESRVDAFQSNAAMLLLRQHPSLVAESFLRQTVLSFFLRAGASVSVIQELCDMWKSINPEYNEYIQWEKAGFHRRPNLVADACLYGSDPNTIKVLVKEFPHQIAQKGDYLRPIKVFLSRCDRYELAIGIADIYECLPPPGNQAAIQILGLFDPNEFPDCNEYVVLGNPGEEISDFLAKTISKVSRDDTGSIDIYDHDGIKRWDKKAIQRAQLFLPRLTRFSLSGIGDNTNLFHSTLNMFCKATPSLLRHLELPVNLEFINRNGNDLFVKAIQSCPNLKELHLGTLQRDLSSTSVTDAQAMCKLCTDIVLWTNDLESLGLTLLPDTDGQSLGKLLRAVAVRLKSFHVRGSLRNVDAWVPFEIPPNVRLQSLTLQTTLGAQATKGILGNMRGVASLTSLALLGQQGDTVDVSNEIAKVLAQNRMESLQIRNCAGVSLQVLVDALKENDSLINFTHRETEHSLGIIKHFAKMMQCNMTLQHVNLSNCWGEPPSGHFYSQVMYLKLLNKCGRGKLSNPKASCDALVVALEAAAAIADYPGDPDNLWYGLLRENPELWAQAALGPF